MRSKGHFGMARELLNRWRGYRREWSLKTSPICFVLWCPETDKGEVEAFLQSLPTRDSLSVVLFTPPADHAYSKLIPANLLRNIGMRNSHTIYVAVMDIELLPSGTGFVFASGTDGLYERLESGLSAQFYNSLQAVAIPVVSLQEPACDGEKGCNDL